MNKLISSTSSAKSRPKKDVIVSVRLPKSLVDELKDIQKVNHFMDLSDEVRFVVRRYCLSFLNSQGQSPVQPPIEMLAEQRRKEKLIEDLTKIIDNLKNTKNSAQTTLNNNLLNQKNHQNE